MGEDDDDGVEIDVGSGGPNWGCVTVIVILILCYFASSIIESYFRWKGLR